MEIYQTNPEYQALVGDVWRKLWGELVGPIDQLAAGKQADIAGLCAVDPSTVSGRCAILSALEDF